MSERPNPFAPPAAGDAATGPAPVDDERAAHETVRRAHIKREASIRSIGTLFLLGCILAVLASFAAVVGMAVVGFTEILIYGVVSIIYGLTAYWLRNLDGKGRVVASILVGLGLVGNLSWAVFTIPQAIEEPPVFVGMLLPLLFLGAILYTLWSKPSNVIFSDHYRNVVVPATPHVKYRSKVAIVILVILLVILLAAVIRGVVSLM